MQTKTTRIGFLLACAIGTPIAAQSLTIGGFLPVGWQGRYIGDVNGDGRDELLLYISGNYVVVDFVPNTPLSHLQRPAVSHSYTGIGDYDGDGKDDLAYWSSFSSHSLVSGADGSTLLTFTATGLTMGEGGDFDGDGRSDLAYVARWFQPGPDTYWVVNVISARTGGSLFQRVFEAQADGVPSQLLLAGDENGDGCDDLVVTYDVFGGPLNFTQSLIVRGGSATVLGPWTPLSPVGDVDGDALADFYTAPSGATAFTPYVLGGGSLTPIWTVGGPTGNTGTRVGDMDGDGFADLRIAGNVLSGRTHLALPGSGPTHPAWLLGDLDGNGRTQCVMNNSHYEWHDPTTQASTMKRRGTPGTTSDGRRPKIATRGHCGLGRTAHFDMRGGLPNGLTLLLYGGAASVDLAIVGAPGNTSYTTLQGAFAFVADGNGVAQYQVTIPVSPTMLGATLSLQALVVDPAANALGLVTSSAVDVATLN